MKEGRDICFTDEQGNEFFVMVRECNVEVWKNKTKIDDVRFYDDELTNAYFLDFYLNFGNDTLAEDINN